MERKTSTSASTEAQPDALSEVIPRSGNTNPDHKPNGHTYHSVHASGHAHVTLGDVHYHNEAPKRSLAKEISSTLFFPEIYTRYDNIEEPHTETFEWILQPPNDDQVAWDSFINWLNTPGGIYWISGKPGSGKSTLMKHLYSELNQSLQESTVLLSFWFWEAATNKLQRTLEGCLQSLLWQLLEHQALGDEVAAALTDRGKLAWTRARLYAAVKAALDCLGLKGVAVWLFLGGLDEGGCDREALVKTVQDICKCHQHVKLCVSSRLERLFEIHLGTYPHLRMQDLNGLDVAIIVKQDLLECPEYLALCRADDRIEEIDLLHVLRYKAEGVLLWVRLVVNDLLRGIRNYDTVRELEKRIKKMPEGLDDLYDLMLRRNGSDAKQYEADAMLYCRLIAHGAMRLIKFCLAIDDELREAYLRVPDDWENLHHRIGCERVKVWITARTGGLLEVNHNSRRSTTCAKTKSQSLTLFLDTYGDQSVHFIHRTARTYFLDRSATHGPSASLPCSLTEIPRRCFEGSLVYQLVLPALESFAPIGVRLFRHALYGCIVCANDLDPELHESVESLFNAMLRKGLLWTDLYSENVTPLGRYEEPFPVDGNSAIAYRLLYASLHESPPKFVVSELLAYPEHAREERCSRLMLYVMRTLPSNKPLNLGVFNFLCDHANPDRLFSNTYGEELSLLHESLYSFKAWLDIDRAWESVATLSKWLQKADSSTFARIVCPTMAACNALLFKRFEGPTTSILGNYHLRARHWAFNRPRGSDSLFEEIRSCLGHDCLKGVAGPSVILDWQSAELGPEIYALSFENSLRLEKEWPPDQQIYLETCDLGVGIVTFPSSHVEFRKARRSLERVLMLSPKLPSMYAALLHISKPEAAIRRFADVEEKRLSIQLNDIVFRQWKAWFWGLEDPELRQYQCRTDYP